MAYFTHPQETWTEAECKKRAAKVNRDGMGTVGGPRGLIANCGSSYVQYGQTKRYNGGCVIGEEWYEGEIIPLPIIPPTYRFTSVSSWGTIIEKV